MTGGPLSKNFLKWNISDCWITYSSSNISPRYKCFIQFTNFVKLKVVKAWSSSFLPSHCHTIVQRYNERNRKSLFFLPTNSFRVDLQTKMALDKKKQTDKNRDWKHENVRALHHLLWCVAVWYVINPSSDWVRVEARILVTCVMFSYSGHTS